MPSRIGKRRRRILYRKGKRRCAYCKKQLRKDEFTVDHIVPLSKGGTYRLGNLAPACYDCNQRKGAKMPWEFGAEQCATS